MFTSTRMRNIDWYILLSALLLAVVGSEGLRCRDGNQQTDAQFEKVLQICRGRQNGQRTNQGQDTENSNGSDESASGEDIFDQRFLSRSNNNNNNRRTDNWNSTSQSERVSQAGDSDNEARRSNFGRRSGRNGNRGGENGRGRDDSGNRQGWTNGRNDRKGGSNTRSNDWYRDENQGEVDPCVVQCIFNELNIVDQKGFPEKGSLIRLMIQNVQDPELRDFYEEAITECFMYSETGGKRNKCEYSQNLLSCLVEKGKERCTDW